MASSSAHSVTAEIVDLRIQAAYHALDQLASNAFVDTSNRLRSAGIHTGILGLIGQGQRDATQLSASITAALHVLRASDLRLQSADSVDSMVSILQQAGKRHKNSDNKADASRDEAISAATFQSTVRALGLQYCLLRYSLAGLFSAQVRRLTKAMDLAAASRSEKQGFQSTSASHSQAPTAPALAHFSLAHYDWLGFDLDHTLVVYKQARRTATARLCVFVITCHPPFCV